MAKSIMLLFICLIVYNLVSHILIVYRNTLIVQMESDKEKPVPFLFSLFLNDIDTFIENKNITGLQTISDEIEKQFRHLPYTFYSVIC